MYAGEKMDYVLVSRWSFTWKFVVENVLMEKIQLLLCMCYIHKERSPMSTCLASKVSGEQVFLQEHQASVFISPINGCHLML